MGDLGDFFTGPDEFLGRIQEDPEGALGEKLHEELTQMAQNSVRQARTYLVTLVEAGDKACEIEPPEDSMAVVVLNVCGYLDLVRTPTGSYYHAPSTGGHAAYIKWKENPSSPFFI